MKKPFWVDCIIINNRITKLSTYNPLIVNLFEFQLSYGTTPGSTYIPVVCGFYYI